jgi:hypothetical protein
MDKLGNGNLAARKGAGRPKGSQNKTTKAAKEAIMMAAEGLGGGKRLTEWAKEDPVNERAFWVSIYPKLLPLEVNATGNLTVTLPSDVTKL